MRVLYQLVPVVDAARCVGCATCADTCPYECLVMVRGEAVLRRPEKCRGEGLCVSACPERAMKLRLQAGAPASTVRHNR